MKIDLHMHSYHSDGKLDCKGLIKEIKEAGIGLFSLTDHDTTNGLEEMKKALIGENLLFIPGVEIATKYEGKEFHLLVYGYDETNEEFIELIEEIKKVRTDFDIEIVKYLDPKVTLEQFLAYEDDPYIGGWPSLNFLKEMGVVETIYDYFDIADACPAKMQFPNPERIITIAHKAGATIFMAHPSSNGPGGLNLETLDYFRLLGLDGLECYSPYSKTEEEVKYYVDYCNKHNMKQSGGSDYHGGFVGRQIGVPHVTLDDISYEYLKQFIWKR